MTLIRFEGTSDRGPSGTLWNHLVDWPTGTLKIAQGVLDLDDFFPYISASVVLSGDSGSAATVSAVPFGVVSFASSSGTYAVAGYARPCYVDLTSITEVCTEAYVSRTAGSTGSEITFVGFSDQAPEAVFHSDGTLDGGSGEDSLGLRWNNDLTVDLVSVVNSTATVLSTAIASAVSNADYHKFGLRVKKISATQYTVYASVDGVVTTVQATTTSLTQAAMRPVAVTTISATDAPVLLVDWHATLDSTQS